MIANHMTLLPGLAAIGGFAGGIAAGQYSSRSITALSVIIGAVAATVFLYFAHQSLFLEAIVLGSQMFSFGVANLAIRLMTSYMDNSEFDLKGHSKYIYAWVTLTAIALIIGTVMGYPYTLL